MLKHHGTTAATNRWAAGLAQGAAFAVPLGEVGEGKETWVAKTRKEYNRGSCIFLCVWTLMRGLLSFPHNLVVTSRHRKSKHSIQKRGIWQLLL